MIILLPALGIRTKIDMLEVGKTNVGGLVVPWRIPSEIIYRTQLA
jgi:hypothetical protein